MSHPSRVRGLKSCCHREVEPYHGVAPFTGAWIEIQSFDNVQSFVFVAPFTGAWIEIHKEEKSMKRTICRTLHGCVD